jgi:hypothetical protein
MNVREKFDVLIKELAELRGQIGQFQETNDSQELRAVLDELLPQFDQAAAGMKDAFPGAIGDIEQSLDACAKQNEETEQVLDELRRKLEEAPVPAATAAVIALSPGYAALLRSEVLARFGAPATAPPVALQPSDSVASAWQDPTESLAGEGKFDVSEVEDSERPAPSPKKPAKPDNNDKEAWEGLTAMED